MRTTSSFAASSPHQRLGLACVAAVATTALLSTLLLLFDQSSPREWLAATPANLAVVARCDKVPDRADRAARDRCKREAVTAALDPAPRQQRLAQR